MRYIKTYNESISYDSVYDIREQFENELSKYLKTGFTEDFIKEFNINVNSNLIFLIDNYYGLRISNIISLYQFGEYNVEVISIKYNKYRNKFTEGNLEDTYYSRDDITIEDFVKKMVKKLKSQDISRKKQRYARELKKDAKKYNL